MKLIPKHQNAFGTPIKPFGRKIYGEQDYLDYWRDNDVETDDALKQRLIQKYGENHMQDWIDQRQSQYDNPQDTPSTGEIKPVSEPSISDKVVNGVTNLFTNPRLGNGQANPFAGIGKTILPATVGSLMITNPLSTIGSKLIKRNG